MKHDELAEGGWYCQPRHISTGTAGTTLGSSSTSEEDGDEPWSVLRAAAAGLHSPRFGGARRNCPACPVFCACCSPHAGAKAACCECLLREQDSRRAAVLRSRNGVRAGLCCAPLMTLLGMPLSAATSPLGSSPGHRGFLVAPSPFRQAAYPAILAHCAPVCLLQPGMLAFSSMKSRSIGVDGDPCVGVRECSEP